MLRILVFTATVMFAFEWGSVAASTGNPAFDMATLQEAVKALAHTLREAVTTLQGA